MRIGLIHAVAVAMQPITDAFQRHWPEAEMAHLLDDRLSVDRAKDDDLSPAMFDRIAALANYSVANGADGILYTCSAFGDAIQAVADAKSMPVLKPNEAMFESALQQGDNIGMLATFERSVPSMEDEFRQMTAGAGKASRIRTVCVPSAMAALQTGNQDGHNKLLAEAASELSDCDAVMLAQFSTSVAQPAVSEVLPCPVLTSPDSAVTKLKAMLQT
ncbi:MAG: aspartate/glutamate racemase family protein [Hyphomicrobiaceae bacterium]